MRLQQRLRRQAQLLGLIKTTFTFLMFHVSHVELYMTYMVLVEKLNIYVKSINMTF